MTGAWTSEPGTGIANDARATMSMMRMMRTTEIANRDGRRVANRATPFGGALAYVVISGGCGPDGPAVHPVRYVGQHVEVHAEAEPAQACGGTLDYLDAYTGYLAARIGEDPDVVVSYHYSPGGESVDDNCSEEPTACAIGNSVFTRSLPDEHELVHAVRYPNRLAYRPIEEGIAELFGDDADWRPDPAGSVLDTLTTYSDGADLPGAYYPLMESFVEYLLAEHGLEALDAYSLATDLEGSFDGAQAAFAGAFGVTLETATVAHANAFHCNHVFSRDTGFDCSAEPSLVALAGSDTMLALDLACEDADVLGPRNGERWRIDAIEVTTPGLHVFNFRRVDGSADALVRVRPCGSGCEAVRTLSVLEVPIAPGAEDTQRLLCMSPGLYVVRTAIADDDEGQVQLRVRAPDGPASCVVR